MKNADLHIHSYYSDGTLSPEEIVAQAADNNVGLLAITDHDEIGGSLELPALCRRYGLSFLPAAEVDALEGGQNIHILAYGVDLSNPGFIDFITHNRALLGGQNVRLIEAMEGVVPGVSLADYHAFSYDRRGGGWKALHYLQSKGLTASLKEGMAFYPRFAIGHDRSGYPSVAEVCRMIRAAGGCAVLAHPGETIGGEDGYFGDTLRHLVSLGPDGVECYYPAHTAEQTALCLALCRERNLIVTAGSDCHGAFGRARVGEMDVPIDQLHLGDLSVRRG